MIHTMNETITNSIQTAPSVEGPIPVTESSYPFCAMAHSRSKLDISPYGYIEEEYFLSGTANIYDETNDTLVIKNENVPYKNRVFIRKPAEKEKFSGRVFIDIYNASNGYDIEDIWRRSYEHYMENGDVYIGITSKPINVLSLKNFDYERYHTLDWSGVEKATRPSAVNNNMSIPGTEEGLVWDIISQTGYLVRQEDNGILNGLKVKYVYLTGQSQSGIYLNTYVYHFHPYLKLVKGSKLFNGYLNVVGAGKQRSLSQVRTMILICFLFDRVASSRWMYLLLPSLLKGT